MCACVGWQRFFQFFLRFLRFLLYTYIFSAFISEKNIIDKHYNTIKYVYNKYDVKNLAEERKYTGMR